MSDSSATDRLSGRFSSQSLPPVDFMQRTRMVFGRGVVGQLGKLVRELGGSRILVVTDRGLRSAGHVDRILRLLQECGMSSVVFDEVTENPTTDDVERCAAAARPAGVDLIVGLGGGSCLDCAKGANFLLTNGGSMVDYKGSGKASKPMLPMIGIPTTAGTGSEAQSFAVIADAKTHLKMACGDPKAACRVAILDPELIVSMPRFVAASSGIDAITHAIESFVSTARNPISQMFGRKAWVLLSGAFPLALKEPQNLEAQGKMLLGAFLAGAAIENSMLGAAHASANPLTAHFELAHGVAVGIMLPHVIRWNAESVGGLYLDLLESARWPVGDRSTIVAADLLAAGFTDLLRAAELPICLTDAVDAKLDETAIRGLAEDAMQQWTGTFNPRTMDRKSFEKLYQSALHDPSDSDLGVVGKSTVIMPQDGVQ